MTQQVEREGVRVDGGPAPLGAAPDRRSVTGPAAPWLRALRVRQWTKNVLVLGAPIASGRVLESRVLEGAGVAFAVFCLCASSVYLVNDVRDVESDRRHPTKRRRPVAAGEVSVGAALLVAVLLGLAGLVLAWWWSPALGATMAVYVALQAGYGLGLKDQPAVDLAIVASGFLLRAVAGGTAADLPMSPWFLLVAAFGSLFMVAGKRYSEIRAVGGATGSRKSLESYSESYLRFIWSMAAGVTVVVYSLWALSGSTTTHLADGTPWALLSLAPFVLGLLRYAADVDRGTAESPEDVVLSDRLLQAVGAAWLVLVLLNAVAS
jgi:decaprenyl-phosphate phosphoribosyltransferase